VLKPLRKALLETGVSVVVPAQHCPGYRLLKSGVVDAGVASSIKGAERQGRPLASLDPAPLRLTLVACVAVSVRGEVLSKGYGFSLPPVVRQLPSATVVHPLQVLEALQGDRPSVDLYATPEAVREV
jgi:5-formyltetrahydrofolate cyclo-ligase